MLLQGTASFRNRSPFNGFVDPPPLWVVTLRLEPAASSFGLLGDVDGPCIDYVSPFSWPQGGVDELLVFFAAPPVGASEGLPRSHHDHAVLLVVVA